MMNHHPLLWFALFCFWTPVFSRYAYVTIHYEGTARDDEYVVGVRTLIRSIKMSGTLNDIIVLCSPNVREESKESFIREGAIIKQVENIANPYKDDPARRRYYQHRFDGTLNKIHIWNLTDYERVLYLDADTIVIHNTDEIFNCGHFCATFMNNLAFHTAVLVVKPDVVEFQRLIDGLKVMESYDGADQGFFVSFFNDLKNAPYFDASKGESNAPMNRLYLGYSMNHIYFYEKSSWDHGYRVYQFRDLPIPAYIMTYPITPVAKPWYWWTYIFLEMNWLWDSYRMELGDSWEKSLIIRVVLIAALIGVSEYLLSKYNPDRASFCKFKHLFYPISIIWFILSLIISMKLVPGLMFPKMALPLFAIIHNTIFFYYLRVMLILLGQSIPGKTSTARLINIGCLLHFMVYLITSHSYSNPIFKIWGALSPVFLVYSHVRLAHYFYMGDQKWMNKQYADKV